jgi:hypothetical protein
MIARGKLIVRLWILTGQWEDEIRCLHDIWAGEERRKC